MRDEEVVELLADEAELNYRATNRHAGVIAIDFKERGSDMMKDFAKEVVAQLEQWWCWSWLCRLVA